MILQKFFFLNKISYKKISFNRTLIKIEPFNNSFCDSIGNFIKRVCFLTTFNYKICFVKFYNVYSEYSNIIGVKEDIQDILDNIKNINVKIYDTFSANLIIKKIGPCTIRVKDIYSDKKIFLLNPEFIIANIVDKKIFFLLMKCVQSNLNLEIDEYFENKFFKSRIIKLSYYNSSIININYFIHNKIYNKKIKKLFFDIETDGIVKPEDCFKNCVFYIKKYFDTLFTIISFEKKIKKIKFSNVVKIIPVFLRSIDNLELSIKSSNFLKKNNIFLIGDLVKKSEIELSELNSISYNIFYEVKKALENKGFSLNTKINYEVQF